MENDLGRPMANRLGNLIMVALVVLALALAALLWTITSDEPEPDPFYMTLVESSSAANETDANLTDLVLWVAVAGGSPHPSWTAVEITAGPEGSGVTLSPPQLRIDDQDGNGRISEGDLLWVSALEPALHEGGVHIWHDGKVIGSV
jgi:hypothetical protein